MKKKVRPRPEGDKQAEAPGPPVEPESQAQAQTPQSGTPNQPPHVQMEVQVVAELEASGERRQGSGRPPPSPGSLTEDTTPTVPMDAPTVSNDWRWRDVEWAFVVGNQAWGTILFILLPVVLAQVAMLYVDPTEQYFEFDDPTINRPAKAVSIPTSAAVLVPFVLFLLALFTGEFWLYGPLHGGLTNAITCTVHFIVGWATAMAIGSFTWWVSGLVVGRLRPDYIARCDPLKTGACQSEPHHGRQSFFAGPSLWSGLSAMYSTVYVLWLVYFRIQRELAAYTALPKGAQSRRLFLQRSLTKERKADQDIVTRLVHEIGHALALYVILIQLGFSWASGAALLIDNRNHPSDVNSGLVVGVLLGGLFSLNFIWLWDNAPKKPVILGPIAPSKQPVRPGVHPIAQHRCPPPAPKSSCESPSQSLEGSRGHLVMKGIERGK